MSIILVLSSLSAPSPHCHQPRLRKWKQNLCLATDKSSWMRAKREEWRRFSQLKIPTKDSCTDSDHPWPNVKQDRFYAIIRNEKYPSYVLETTGKNFFTVLQRSNMHFLSDSSKVIFFLLFDVEEWSVKLVSEQNTNGNTNQNK